MAYYKLSQDNFWDYYIEENPKLDSEISFLSGKRIDEEIKLPLIFEISGPVKLDPNEFPGHFLGDVIPIVSTQFVEVLEKAGIDNYQIFPAILKMTSKKLEWDDYYAFNVVGLVEGVDESSSNAGIIMDGDDDVPALVDFEEIVIDREKVRDLKIFRELYSGVLIVDDIFDKCLDEINPKGDIWHIDLVELGETS